MANALSFVTEFDIIKVCTGGSTTQHVYSANNDIHIAKCTCGADGTTEYDLYGFELVAFENVNHRELLYDGYKNTSMRDQGVRYYQWNDQSITTATNGGDLLQLANHTSVNTRFFGGVQQTAATLYAFLCNKYGNYAAFAGNYPLKKMHLGIEYSGVGNLTGYDCEGCFKVFSNYYPYDNFPYQVDCTSEVTVASEYATVSRYVTSGWLVFGDAPDPTQLHFDVYVNGTKDPNVTVQWSAVSLGENVSLQLVNPIVWCYPDPLTPGLFEPIVETTIDVDEVNVPNDSQWYVLKHAYTWAGQYFNPYVSEYNTIVALSGYNTINKIIVYGLDGIANNMHYYLRFNMQYNLNNTGIMTWGKLFDVKVPREPASASDITVTEISESDYRGQFTTTVTVHFGAPPDEPSDDDPSSPSLTDPDGEDSPIGPYDPDYGAPDLDTYESTGFSGSAVLTKTYAFNAATAANVGSKLWSQSYLDVLKIQNNPIENIISMKWYPMAFTGASTSIKVGDVDFGINGASIGSMYTKTIGSFKYTVDSSRPGYLSCSPYTTIKMHLPYCGTVQLDATEILNRTVYVKYIVDLITGDCLVLITLDNSVPYMEVSGKMGVDIPLTASNRMQTELAAASRALSASIGAAGHMLAGDVAGAANEATGIMSFMGQDYATQRTQTHSSACATYANRAIYVEIRRPNWDPSNGYRSRHGRPFHKYVKLSSLTGFVQVDARTTINEAMTEEENHMLEQILTTGFYL